MLVIRMELLEKNQAPQQKIKQPPRYSVGWEPEGSNS